MMVKNVHNRLRRSLFLEAVAKIIKLSSPRAKRAGPKGLRAESARADGTPTVGGGKTF